MVILQAARTNYSMDPERLSGLQDFSHEQTFFLAGCYLDCGTDSDCGAALKHSPWFSGAFACRRGAPMNPDDKCSFW